MFEFGAKMVLNDGMFTALKKNHKMQKDFQDQVKMTSASIERLGKTKADPVIKAKDESSKVIQKIKSGLATVSSAVSDPVIRARDQATRTVEKVKNQLKAVHKTVSTPFIRAKDGASTVVNKIRNGLKTVSKVFTPFVKIRDGTSKILNSLHNQLKKVGSFIAKPFVMLKDGASKALSKMMSMLKTLAKGVTIGVATAGAGATALLGGSISQGASLEQSMGGVETLFKGDASTVKANADMAFKTAGLSANAYMETVTGFSASLLNSLGGDTAKSAKIADMAIIDMADNANKFGTDMEAIQNAYQGFAKQNYTMLDNLKLGYGGTQEEMARLLKDATKLTGVQYNMDNLSDVYSAVHAIQENLGVTGTTAKEASSTFSGSFASMKASAQNLLGNLAVGGDVTSSMEQLVDSASTFLFDNAIPMIGRIFEGLPDAISVAVEKGAPKLKELGGKIVSSIKSGLKSALPSELGVMVDPAFDGIGTAISGTIGSVKSLLQGLLPVVTSIITAIIPHIQAILPAISSIGAMVGNVFPMVSKTITTAWNASIPVTQAFSNIIQSAMPLVEGAIRIFSNTVSTIMPVVSSIFAGVGEKVTTVIDFIGSKMGFIQSVFDTVCPIIADVLSTAWSIISPVMDVMITIFKVLWKVVEFVFPAIQGVIQTVWGVLSPIFDALASAMKWVGDAVSSVVGWFGDVFSGVFDSPANGAVKSTDAKSRAIGVNRVPYDNYPINAHQGEMLLNRVEADRYQSERGTRGIQLNDIKPSVVIPQNSPINSSYGSENSPSKGISDENIKSLIIEKLADTLVIREDADVGKIVEAMVKRMKKVMVCMV